MILDKLEFDTKLYLEDGSYLCTTEEFLVEVMNCCKEGIKEGIEEGFKEFEKEHLKKNKKEGK